MRLRARRDLDLDLHALVGERADLHRRRRQGDGEGAPERRPAGLEVVGARQQVAHAHDVVETRARLLERAGDVASACSACSATSPEIVIVA